MQSVGGLKRGDALPYPVFLNMYWTFSYRGIEYMMVENYKNMLKSGKV